MVEVFTPFPDGGLAAPVAERIAHAGAEWLAHLEAGRIGRREPRDPAIAANLARTDAIFAARAAQARRG